MNGNGTATTVHGRVFDPNYVPTEDERAAVAGSVDTDESRKERWASRRPTRPTDDDDDDLAFAMPEPTRTWNAREQKKVPPPSRRSARQAYPPLVPLAVCRGQDTLARAYDPPYNLTNNEAMVLGCLFFMSQKDNGIRRSSAYPQGYCQPSQKMLAMRFHLSVAGVKKMLARLEALGLIRVEVHKLPKARNKYAPTVPDEWLIPKAKG